MAPADGFLDSKWIWVQIGGGIGGQLWLCCGLYNRSQGLLDGIRSIFCVQALVFAFWFSLQQLLDYFLTPGELGLKSFILGNILYFALVLHIKQIDEPFEPAELEFRTPVLWKHFLE